MPPMPATATAPRSDTRLVVAAAIAALGLLVAPFLIARAPIEPVMGPIQKIFYFHVPTAIAMFISAFVAGIASAIFLFGKKPHADRVALAAAELTIVFGFIVLVTGPLWARKAWGVWWQWDARLTMAFLLELIFIGYLPVRKYGGPGSEKLAAAMGIFGGATAPFVYKSVDWWRTIHPKTSVMTSLGETSPEMWYVVWLCVFIFLLMASLLLALRMRLEALRAELDELYLAAED
jgi:heme exporter protein C